MSHRMSKTAIENFKMELIREERSDATVKKYVRDLETFRQWLGSDKTVRKERVISYKNEILQKHAVTSANSMLAALNSFFKRMGWYDCVVHSVKVQREAFRDREREMTKEEYYRLLDAARQKGNDRLYQIMETICSTGIRVSELKFITVESLFAKRARVRLKGKMRTILLTPQLCGRLKRYAKEHGIKTGSIFVTRTGKPVDRSNILHAMKGLCDQAKVDRSKVFPHNLRHLFACTYYQLKKDLTHLADLLGHASINTTRIYTLVSSEEQSRQIETLGLLQGTD